MQTRITLLVVRALFFLLASGLGLYIAQDITQRAAVTPSKAELKSLIDKTPENQVPALLRELSRQGPQDGALELRHLMLAISLAALAVLAEAMFSRGDIQVLAAIVFGIIVGTVMANLFVGLIALFADFSDAQGRQALGYIRACVTLVLVYFAVSTLLRTKDDFKFIIPYVEFQKRIKGPRPFVVDTSAIIDGRLKDLAEVKLFDAPFVVPTFVVEELHKLADSHDKLKRSRGRRGLDLLRDLQKSTEMDVQMHEGDYPDLLGVDQKALQLAQELEGRLVTTDFNLQKRAGLAGVEILNVNDLARAVRTRYVPGDQFEISIAKAGESEGQGVGYLEDGTMVVVEEGGAYVGARVAVSVSNIYQSSGGRMIFARVEPDGNAKQEAEVESRT